MSATIRRALLSVSNKEGLLEFARALRSRGVTILSTGGTAAMLRLSGSTNRGATSLGLTSTAQPASSAGIASINDSVNGKFHGLITPTSAYGTSCER